MSRHFVVDRKDQPKIDQELLEEHSKTTEGRGEYLLQYAQEQRDKFDNDHDDNDDENKDDKDEDKLVGGTNPMSKNSSAKLPELEDMVPEKDELLY